MSSKILPGALSPSAGSGRGMRAQNSFDSSNFIKIGESRLEAAEFDEKRKSFIEQSRLALKQFLLHSVGGRALENFLIFLSIVSCLEVIFSTYLKDGHDDTQIAVTNVLELVLEGFYFVDWALHFYAAEHRVQFISSSFSLIYLISAVAVFTTYNRTCPAHRDVISFEECVHYVLCGLNTVRILRALRLSNRILLMENEVQKFLSMMALKIILMILFNAAAMQYLEIHEQNLPFHTWTYYMVVTISTVGYGDFSPISPLGRFFAMGMISYAIITVPKMSNELIELLSKQSVYARARYHPKVVSAVHVLICGDLRSTSLREFFNELFHEDHDIRNLHAVILQPETPNYEMMQILKDPAFSLQITYLEGNTLNENDLRRAMASKAKAIFIMTNKFSSDPDEEDAKTILQQFSIQRFIRLHSMSVSGRSSLFCLQLVRPENKRHLVTTDGLDNSQLVICLNEMKMGVIAKSVVFPGTNTLIMNLISSFSDDKDEAVKETNVNGIENLEDDEVSNWIGEYQRGCDWEIYTTGLSEIFEGATFAILSEILYQKLGIVLFAVEIEDIHKAQTKLLLNPADYVIPPKNSEFRIEAFVLAKNKAQSDLTFAHFHEHGQSAMGMSGSLNYSQLSLLANGLASKIRQNQEESKSYVRNHSHSDMDSKDDSRRPHIEKLAWQSLLRGFEVPKTNATVQEELQKLYDLYLRDNYFIRDVPCELGDALIKTSVMQETPFVDNHIIIIGKALSNLYDLIRPLRAKQLGVLKPIVIVFPGDFPVAVWQRVNVFESIYIVRGSALEEADIRRAGVFQAKHVVVLADASAESASSDANKASAAAGLDALVDADAIFCYQFVRRMNENAHVVVEIVRHTNVSYLDPESGLNSGDVDYKFTSQFASGALFTSGSLDTLVCQAFYNTKIIEVVNRLIGVVDAKTHYERQHQQSKSSTMIGSSLYQIPIPEGLESRTYGSLFRLLARRKQIPLGILRGVYSHTKSGPKANKMPYVFTNPPKDTELFSCDRVFVLSQTPVKLNRVAKDDVKENQMYENLRTRQRKTAEDIIKMVGELRDDVRAVEGYQEHLDVNLAQMAADFDMRFEQLADSIQSIKNFLAAAATVQESSSSSNSSSGGSGSGGKGDNNNNNNRSSLIANLIPTMQDCKGSPTSSRVPSRPGSRPSSANRPISAKRRPQSANSASRNRPITTRQPSSRSTRGSAGADMTIAGYAAAQQAMLPSGLRSASASPMLSRQKTLGRQASQQGQGSSSSSRPGSPNGRKAPMMSMSKLI